MTIERLEQLQEIRANVSNLWGVLLTDFSNADGGLNFIPSSDRRRMRTVLVEIMDQISNRLDMELGA